MNITPAFTLRVDDNYIDDKILSRVTSYEYEESEGIDKLTVKFDNYDLSLDDYKFFTVGNILWTKYGYVNQLSDNKLLILRTIKGFKEITIEAFEAAKKFDSEPKERVFEKATISQLVGKIATEHNLKYKFEERLDANGNVLQFDYIQPNIPDLSFLASVGKKIGFKAWIEGDTLYFMPRMYWQTPYKKYVYYGDEGNIISFEPELKVYDNTSKLNAAGIDIEKKKVFKVKEDGKTSKEKRLSNTMINYDTVLIRKDSKGSRQIIHSDNSKKAQNILTGLYNQKMEEQITAKLVIVGDAELISKRVIEVLNVGKWSGKYFVKKVVQSINGSGFVSTAYLSRNSLFDNDSNRYSLSVINNMVNKTRFSVKQFFKKYPKSVYKRLYR